MCACVFCRCVPVVDTQCVVWSAQLRSGPGYAYALICSSGHCWASRPVRLKGGAGRQRSSREGENMLDLLASSCGYKHSQSNWFAVAGIRCDSASWIFAAWRHHVRKNISLSVFIAASFQAGTVCSAPELPRQGFFTRPAVIRLVGSIPLSYPYCCLCFTVCFTAVADFSSCISIAVSLPKYKSEIFRNFTKYNWKVWSQLFWSNLVLGDSCEIYVRIFATAFFFLVCCLE